MCCLWINNLLYLCMRNLSEIVSEIKADWKKVNYGASPYLDAMSTMGLITDKYGFDDGRSIILYFLSNASSWRGAKVVLIKGELNLMLK